MPRPPCGPACGRWSRGRERLRGAGMSDRGQEAHSSLARYRGTVSRVLDALLEADPVWATQLGDHRFDAALPDRSPAAIEARAGLLSEALAALDGLDDAGLDSDDLVDLESLRSKVS